MSLAQLFSQLQAAPPDPILGLVVQFNADANPNKVNLCIGVYQDESGKVPRLDCIVRAEELLVKQHLSPSYLPIEGLANYTKATQSLIFGADSKLISDGRIATLQTPGGTAACKVVADFLKRITPSSTIYLSDPSWENHRAICEAAGFKVETYPYYDPQTKGLAWGAMRSFISKLPADSILLIHACCHNPTGVDLSKDQWLELRDIVKERGHIVFIDMAYQGFGSGLDEDAFSVRLFAESGTTCLVASSYSKSFSIYNERVGSLSAVCGSADEAKVVLSQLRRTIRSNYSNPPAHGARAVQTVLDNTELRATWERELAQMRSRIANMRKAFAGELKARNIAGSFDAIINQRGMFSYTGLSKDQIAWLQKERGIYLVGSGRMCVAALNESNIGYVAQSFAEVLQSVKT